MQNPNQEIQIKHIKLPQFYQADFSFGVLIADDVWSALMISFIKILPNNHNFLKNFKNLNSTNQNIQQIYNQLKNNDQKCDPYNRSYGQILKQYIQSNHLITNVIEEKHLSQLCVETQTNITLDYTTKQKKYSALTSKSQRDIILIENNNFWYQLIRKETESCSTCNQRNSKLYRSITCQHIYCLQCLKQKFYYFHLNPFKCSCQKSLFLDDFQDVKLCVCCSELFDLNSSQIFLLHCGHYFCRNCLNNEKRFPLVASCRKCKQHLTNSDFELIKDQICSSCQQTNQNLKKAKCGHYYCDQCLQYKISEKSLCKKISCQSYISFDDDSGIQIDNKMLGKKEESCQRCNQIYTSDLLFKSDCMHQYCKQCFVEMKIKNQQSKYCVCCTKKQNYQPIVEFFINQLDENCLKCFKETQKQFTIECGHHFCKLCIENLQGNSKQCYQCGKIVDLQIAKDYFNSEDQAEQLFFKQIDFSNQVQCDICKQFDSKNRLFTNENIQCNHKYCLQCIEKYREQLYMCQKSNCNLPINLDKLERFYELYALQQSQIDSVKIKCQQCFNEIETSKKAQYINCNSCKNVSCILHKCLMEKCLCKCRKCLNDLVDQGDNYAYCQKCSDYYCLTCKVRMVNKFHHECTESKQKLQQQISQSPNVQNTQVEEIVIEQQHPEQLQFSQSNEEIHQQIIQLEDLTDEEKSHCSSCFIQFDEFSSIRNSEKCKHIFCLLCKFSDSNCMRCTSGAMKVQQPRDRVLKIDNVYRKSLINYSYFDRNSRSETKNYYPTPVRPNSVSQQEETIITSNRGLSQKQNSYFKLSNSQNEKSSKDQRIKKPIFESPPSEKIKSHHTVTNQIIYTPSNYFSRRY